MMVDSISRTRGTVSRPSGARLGVACWLLVLGVGLAPAAGAAPVVTWLDSLLQAQSKAGFSGAVLVARGDSIRFEGVYGTAAGASERPVAFWLASCSKQFTATAILRLQEQNRLRVSDRIDRFVPSAPTDKRGITIHQLLTHTSGLPSEYRADGIVDRDRAIDAILRLRLKSPPGTTFSYSNDGYTLLAAIVEIASGISFDDYVADSLFARAGLTHTGLWGHEDPGIALAPVANPRELRARRPTIYRDGHSVANWGYRGPTGVYTTPRDLHTWVAALWAGRVLGPEALRQLLGRHVLVRDDSTGQSYAGYGWGIRVEGGQDVSYGHTGGEDWLGHNSVVRFDPAENLVVVLSNSGESGGESWASRVNREIRHRSPAEPPRSVHQAPKQGG